MSNEHLKRFDDLQEFETYMQLRIEAEDKQHQQVLSLSVFGVFEGFFRCRRNGKWFMLVRDTSDLLRFIPTNEIKDLIRLSPQAK